MGVFRRPRAEPIPLYTNLPLVRYTNFQDVVLWVRLDAKLLQHRDEVPPARIRRVQTLPAGREVECLQGAGEKREGVQGTQKRVESGSSGHKPTARVERPGGQDDQDCLLQVAGGNQILQGGRIYVLL